MREHSPDPFKSASSSDDITFNFAFFAGFTREIFSHSREHFISRSISFLFFSFFFFFFFLITPFNISRRTRHVGVFFNVSPTRGAERRGNASLRWSIFLSIIDVRSNCSNCSRMPNRLQHLCNSSFGSLLYLRPLSNANHVNIISLRAIT